MIIKGSQRASAGQLAWHLLNAEDNEHVEIHEIRGFIADDLRGAFAEMQALSMGTRCVQYMFSVSLNPPQNVTAPPEYFEKAIADIEAKCGLSGQPRVVVFHEKEGRRHAHCVWSRIRTDEMKAINLPYYKMKLNDVSRELFLHYGWDLPRGFIDKHYTDPANFTLVEWQQALRSGENPQMLKAMFRQAWESSDSGKAFAHALQEKGFTLARGDRRGFVAVDFRGEVYSLSRWLGVKSKPLAEKLGDPQNLPSVDEAKARHAQKMKPQISRYIEEFKEQANRQRQPLLQQKRALRDYHRKARVALTENLEKRRLEEARQRQSRLPKGLKGLWSKMTGSFQKIAAQNEQETATCDKRDRSEKQTLIERQMKERRNLQERIAVFKERFEQERQAFREDIARYLETGGLRPERQETRQQQRNRGFAPEL